MNENVIINADYRWYNKTDAESSIYSIGYFWYEKKFFEKDTVSNKILAFFNAFPDIENSYEIFISEISNKFNGHFSFIISNKNITIAFVDKIRSFPVYYSTGHGKKIISNSANELQRTLELYDVNEQALLAFRMAGYTLAGSTLYKNLNQLQAGEYLVYFKKNDKIKTKRYFRYLTKKENAQEETDNYESYEDILYRVFTRLIESLRGRPAFLPLSGGLDSKLILSMLHNLGYKDIVTYSYGIKGLWDVERAKSAAEFFNIKWIYTEFKPSETRRIFNSQIRKDFYNFASGLNSIPHVADLYSIRMLEERRLIPKDAVIINGQTGDFLTGGHIPSIVMSDRLTSDDLCTTIIDKHFALWTNLMTEENLKTITYQLLYQAGLKPHEEITKQQFADYYEMLEWEERQSKHVANGQKVYDWLGYDWRLPLWDDELIYFWNNAPLEMKFERKFHKEFLFRHNSFPLIKKELQKSWVYMPFQLKLLNYFFAACGKLLGKNLNSSFNKYAKYFLTYAPYYTQLNYKDYLKDSYWHRSPVSYWVNSYLEEINLSNGISNQQAES
ncbi:MAG: hypothetical protein IH949_01985 [Bacteroidetes bacterium]|nr:hypothetical protein [Bacteroidota bacterium]